MNVLYAAALEVQSHFDEQGWQSCIIGGLAVARWGQPRATQDVDISLLTEFGTEAARIAAILERFPGRFPDAGDFAKESRVVLATASNGVPLDIALAAFPYEERLISRASSFRFQAAVSLRTASAEDTVVLKAFAGRDQDWLDVEGILIRQPQLDWKTVDRELEPLCRMQDDLSPFQKLQRMRSDIDSHS